MTTRRERRAHATYPPPPGDTPAPVPGFLAAASENTVDIDELMANWRMARIAIRCAGAARAAENPNTPAKIRGAWGRALAEDASPGALDGGPCDWAAPCAYDLFFNVQGHLIARLELPKPFVLAVTPVGADLEVALTLFGVAADWAGEAAAALIRALRTGLDGGGRRRALAPMSREVGVAEGLPAVDCAGGAALDFLSPVALRSGAEEHADPAALLTSLANRVGGLARWHGMRLEVDPSDLKAEAARIGAGAEWRAAAPVAWRRASRAQGRRTVLRGLAGSLLLPPASPWMGRLLTIGAETHVGSRCALGMGRYELLTLG